MRYQTTCSLRLPARAVKGKHHPTGAAPPDTHRAPPQRLQRGLQQNPKADCGRKNPEKPRKRENEGEGAPSRAGADPAPRPEQPRTPTHPAPPGGPRRRLPSPPLTSGRPRRCPAATGGHRGALGTALAAAGSPGAAAPASDGTGGGDGRGGGGPASAASCRRRRFEGKSGCVTSSPAAVRAGGTAPHG